MGGIVGFYPLEKDTARERMDRTARAMGDAIRHRGPDGEGVWIDPDVPMVLGHRRLSVIDLSGAGAQPMISASGRYAVVFDGEVYNYQELRADLESDGAQFRGRSDTETMLESFEHWGINRALQRINGMFAMAVWDREKRQLHLIRDRMGKKPLYVGWAGKDFVFASELKAFRAHPSFRPEIDRNALTLYMRFGGIPAPHTIYQGVWQMMPGTRLMLVFDLIAAGDDLVKDAVAYWDMPRVVEEACHNPLRGSDAELIDQFEATLRDCVRDRMGSDVPVGAFLSGGVDSAAVAALMQAQSSQRIKTFSIGFNERGYDEAAAAQAVARHLGTEHHEMIATAADARTMIERLPQIYDEPFADASQIATCLLAGFAGGSVGVALSGVGGDEMLGGHARYQAIPALWRRVGWWPRNARLLLARGIRRVEIERWNRMVRAYPQFGERLYRIADLLCLRDLEDVYIHVLSHWPDPSLLVRDGREPLTVLHDSTRIPHDLTAAERMMLGDDLFYLPNNVLTRIDRAGMAAGLEVRAPLLDYHLFDFFWRLPPDAKVRQGQGKWLLRQVVARHVPDHLFDRTKQGFAIPVGEWLRGPALQDWAHDLLRPQRLEESGFINPAPITTLWQDHLDGRGNHGTRLWTVLMFQLWHTHWMHRDDANS